MRSKTIPAVVLGLSLSMSSIDALATGVPTIDIATVTQLENQLLQMKQEYDVLTKQYAAVVGSYGRGAQGLTSAVTSSSVVPGSWQDVVAQQKNGVYANLQSSYEQVMSDLSPSSFTDSGQGATYKLNKDAAVAGLSMSEALYNDAQTHLQNFQSLAAQVDTTVNVKDATDLQNRMTAELGMAQASQNRLQAVLARMSAAQINDVNEADAQRAKFFGQVKTGASQ